MKKIAILVAIILIAQVVFAEQILEIEMIVYKDDSVELKNLRIIDSDASVYVPEGDYKVEISDANGGKILEQPYRLSFMIFTDPPIEVNSSILYLKTSYNPEMLILKLFNGEREIFSAQIDVCNDDGICQIGFENSLSCPDDCPLDKNDGICIKESDYVCDPDCSEGVDPDCTTVPTTTYGEITTTEITTDFLTTETTEIETTTTTMEKKEEPQYLSYLILLVSAIVVLVAVFLYISGKKNRTVESDNAGEDKIISWIKEKLKEGEDPEVLKRGLQSEGYDPKIVDKIKREL